MNGRSLVISPKGSKDQNRFRLTDANAALTSLFKCKDELAGPPPRRAPPPPPVMAQRMPAPPPPAPLPARPAPAPQFSVEWVQPGGNFRVAATRGGPPNAPLCVHALSCSCPGQGNYCGNFRNGETALFWDRGCNRRPMTIQCAVRPSFAAAPPPPPPPPAPPPPRQQAAGPGESDGCPAPGTVRSRLSNQRTVIQFANSTRGTIDIFWLDYDGRRKLHRSLRPGEDYQQSTFVGHPWIVVDRSGRCRGGVYWPRPGRNLNEVF